MKNIYKKLLIIALGLFGILAIGHFDIADINLISNEQRLVVYQQPIFISKFGH